MSHPKNIQEFVAYKVIEYLKVKERERDEEIQALLQKIKHLEEGFALSNSESLRECVKCKKWIDYTVYDNVTFSYCDNCYHFIICDDCCNSDITGYGEFSRNSWFCEDCR